MTDFAPRESKSFKTKAGHEVEFYTELTGGEFNEVQRCYIKGAETQMDVVRQQPTNIKYSLETQIDAEYKTIEFLVFKLDGSSENVLERIKNLPQSEYAQIIGAVNAEVAKKKEQSSAQ